jgi:hypothetical protein
VLTTFWKGEEPTSLPGGEPPHGLNPDISPLRAHTIALLEEHLEDLKLRYKHERDPANELLLRKQINDTQEQLSLLE